MKLRDRFGFGAVGAFAIVVASGQAFATGVSLTCANSGSDTLATAITGSTPWTVGGTHIIVDGDTIELTGICQGDIAFGDLHGVTVINHSALTTLVAGDGINGQVEIKGGSHIHFYGITLEGGQSGESMTFTGQLESGSGEFANVMVHDSSAVKLVGDFVGPGPLVGVGVYQSSSALLLNTTVSGNGTTNIRFHNSGLQAEGGSSFILGNLDDSSPDSITTNVGSGLALVGGSSALIYGTTFNANGDCSGTACAPQLSLLGATAAILDHATVETTLTTASQPPLIEALGGSAVWLQNGSSVENTGSGAASGAILAGGESSISLNSSTVSASGSSNPVIEASASSTIVLAGGNTISSTGGSGSCVGSSACVIQADHSSSVMHIPATNIGFAAVAAESISGNGLVQEQSSMDLGQGPISGAYSLVWTGSIQVQQNSSFRMSGGAHVTGAVQLAQAANGFFNYNNSGGSGNAGNPGAGNAVDGAVQCSGSGGAFNTSINGYVQGNSNVSSHVANPNSVTPHVTVGSDADFLGITTNHAVPPACLNF